MRLFKERNIAPEGLVLPRDVFTLAIDERSANFCPIKGERLVKEAEEELEKPITVIPLWSYRQYVAQGSVSIYGAPFANRLKSMLRLGFAEAYERKGRFTEKLCDLIWAMLEESSWVIPEHTVVFPYRKQSDVPPVVGEKYMHGIELGSAYRAGGLALVYHLLKEEIDGVSPIIGERLLHELKRRVITPYLTCQFHWSGEFGNKPNNWCPWIVSNVLLVTALVEDNDYDRTRVVKLALSHLDNFTDRYKPDGGCDEGPTYWGAAAGTLFDCLELLYDMTGGRINVFDEPLVRAMGEYLPSVNLAGNRFANFADSSGKLTHDGNMIERYGRKCSSEVMVSFGKVMASIAEPYFNFHQPYRMYRALLTPSIYGSEIKQLADRQSYLGDLKIMVVRDSQDPYEGVCLAMKGGTNGEAHNHNDVGSFILYSGGEPVLIDAGVGAYTRQTFSKDRYKIWSMRSAYHNLPLFGGVEQRAGADFASSDEVYNAEECSLSLELRNAYPEGSGIVSYRRTCSLCNSVVTVKESICLDHEMEVDFILMTPSKPLAECGALVLKEGVVLNYPSAVDIEVEELDPIGINTLSNFGSDKLYRIHMRTTIKNGELIFTLDGRKGGTNNVQNI